MSGNQSSSKSSNYESAQRECSVSDDRSSGTKYDDLGDLLNEDSLGNSSLDKGQNQRQTVFDQYQRITIYPWKILASKVVFFKNYYLFPITVNLVQVGNDFFVVRLSKFDTVQLKTNIKFLVIENLAGVSNKSTGNADSWFIREIKLAFKDHNWEDFLVNLVVVNEDSISFNPNIGYISYIEF